MPIIGTARFTERIKFFDGQRLFASDLQDVEQFNREMRWLHNQSLHQAGVASGYAVSGKKDDREVTIQPGYAIDSSGREIVLTQPEVLQVPPVAGDGQGNPVYYDLTVSYPDDQSLKETETRDGICAPRSAVRRREKPVFCWIELVATGESTGPNALAADYQPRLSKLRDDLESGARIRLARAEVLNCKLNQPLSVAQRRNAKPAMQPFLSAGREFPTETNFWKAEAKNFGVAITLRVDTSSANFRTPPRYFAHVVGNRELKPTVNGKEITMVLDGFVRLGGLVKPEEVSEVGFIFSLLIPAILFERNLDPGQVATGLQAELKKGIDPTKEEKRWYIEWMGIEG